MDIVEYRPGDAYTRIARINKTEKWKKVPSLTNPLCEKKNKAR